MSHDTPSRALSVTRPAVASAGARGAGAFRRRVYQRFPRRPRNTAARRVGAVAGSRPARGGAWLDGGNGQPSRVSGWPATWSAGRVPAPPIVRRRSGGPRRPVAREPAAGAAFPSARSITIARVPVVGRPGRPNELSSRCGRRRHVHRPGPGRPGRAGADAQGPLLHRQLRRGDRPWRARADGGGRHRRGRHRRADPRDDRRHERDPRAPGARGGSSRRRGSATSSRSGGSAWRGSTTSTSSGRRPRPAALAAQVTERLGTGRGGPDAARSGERHGRPSITSRAGVESIAIAFLHAYASGAHEQAAAAIVRERAPGVLLTLSSEILPEVRESSGPARR